MLNLVVMLIILLVSEINGDLATIETNEYSLLKSIVLWSLLAALFITTFLALTRSQRLITKASCCLIVPITLAIIHGMLLIDYQYYLINPMLAYGFSISWSYFLGITIKGYWLLNSFVYAGLNTTVYILC